MRTEQTESIVVTGAGAILPTSRGLEALWSAVRDGEPAFSNYRDGSITTQLMPWFGHVPEAVTLAARQQVPHKLRRFASDYGVWAVLSAQDALDQAGSWTAVAEERRGLYVGQCDTIYPSLASLSPALKIAYGAEGLDFAKLTGEALHRRGTDPFTVIKGLSNNVFALLSMTYNFRGDCSAFVPDESAAIAALKRACFSLTHGYCDIALVVGAGNYGDPLMLTELYQLGHLSASAHGRHSLRSFDRERDGTLLGEGAVALALERAGDARRRGAQPLLEIAGILGTTADPGSPANISHLSGRVRSLLAEAGIEPTELGLVCADGKGGVAQDGAEMAVLEAVLDGAPVPVTSQRPIIGTLSAAGPLADIVLAGMVFRQETVPPVATLATPGAAGIDFVRGAARHRACATALTTHASFNGFFGATLLKHPSYSML
jgi:3-oxoacyl-(acyl-carrier-protein) synthase